MAKVSLVGSSSEWRVAETNGRRAINWFPHVDQAGGKEQVVWVGTPGTSLVHTLPALARGFHIWDSTGFVVAGNALYSTNGSTLSGVLGTLATSTGYVSMAHSRQQLVICDGTARVYVWNGTTFTTVAEITDSVALAAAGTIVVANTAVALVASPTVTVSSNVATYTSAAAHLGTAGDIVTVAGHTIANFNGAKTILAAPTPTTFTAAVTYADGGYNEPAATASIVLATATATAAHGLSAGDSATISGHTDAFFNATWTVLDAPATTTFRFKVVKATGTYASPAASVAHPIPFTITPTRCTFMDGYFAVAQSTTATGVHPGQVYYSAYEDALVWTASRLLVPQRDPDALLTPYARGGDLILLGGLTTELWFNAGTSALDPFEPARAAAISWGIAAPWTAANLKEGVAWVGVKANSSPAVVLLEGYAVATISTPPVDRMLKANAANLATATAYSYLDEGHEFYVLTVGTNTWVYDASTQVWHERQSWTGAAWAQHRGRWYGYIGGKHLLTDYSASALLATSLDTVTDYVAGSTANIRRLGRSGVVAAENRRNFHLMAHVETSHPATAASIMLKWSDDGGTTWTAGETVETSGSAEAEFFGLGEARRRIYEVSTESPAFSSVSAMWVLTDPGEV